jgi:hypothetical protein
LPVAESWGRLTVAIKGLWSLLRASPVTPAFDRVTDDPEYVMIFLQIKN